MSKDRGLDRREFLKGLSLLAGTLAIRGSTGLAQPAIGEISAAECPLQIEIGDPLVKLRRPERKFTVYFDLQVEMPRGRLIQVKRTVRIIRAISRRFRGREEVIFIPVITRAEDISKQIKGSRISALGEENVLVDFAYICNTLKSLSGMAFAVEILIEARGIVPDRGEICSANKLVVKNFEVPQVCKL
ncbi:MAG: hypothetical protein QHH25_02215 [Candidatus Acetothermia bacterium]|jgi:hypothetical protein|nr:hypothetical protein [Candidatus Acetothermia bacterium]